MNEAEDAFIYWWERQGGQPDYSAEYEAARQAWFAGIAYQINRQKRLRDERP